MTYAGLSGDAGTGGPGGDGGGGEREFPASPAARSSTTIGRTSAGSSSAVPLQDWVSANRTPAALRIRSRRTAGCPGSTGT